MKPIDNVHHAVKQAQAERLKLSHMVVTAWHKTGVDRIAAEAVRALGINKPEVELDDVIPDAHVGIARDLLAEAAKGTVALISADDVQEVCKEFAALVARATETKDEDYLENVRHHVAGAIALSLAARLDGVNVEDAYRRGFGAANLALSFVVEVADYWRDYKEQSGQVDVADLLVTELEPIEKCELCLIDRRDIPVLAMQALRRMLPRAYFCTV